jgi:hypothetical protein
MHLWGYRRNGDGSDSVQEAQTIDSKESAVSDKPDLSAAESAEEFLRKFDRITAPRVNRADVVSDRRAKKVSDAMWTVLRVFA